MARTLAWCSLALLAGFGACVPRQALYPFGLDHGDTRLPVGDDISSDEVKVRTPIAFYDQFYNNLYVNLNGHLSFDTELPVYKSDLVLPLGFKVIVPFLADVDNRLSGNVFYRETQDPSLLELASSEISSNFPEDAGFQAEALFIATWDDVGYYKQQYDKTNTFQVVIASDGFQSSYVFFHYADDGIQWIRSQGKTAPVLEDVPAQAGFDAGEKDGLRYYALPGSGNLEVEKLASASNVGVPGVWVFRVGILDGGNIETPATDNQGWSPKQKDTPGGALSCSTGGAQTCHSNARCEDHSTGFCCQCIPPSYGNGRSCLEPDTAQRVNGKVSGTVNGVPIQSEDLHAYVVIKDGRAYTAISRIPEALGVSMQSLYAVGSVIGWLFAAKASPKAKNGFMITGGEFNRTATVRFGDGQKMDINQQFVSQDALGYMRVNTQLNGEIPTINKGAKVTVDDYKEDYSKVGPGLIKSYGTHTYRVDGIAKRFNLEQNIRFHDCGGSVDDDAAMLRLNVIRNFLVYGENEQIVRFAMTNRISTQVGEDPCRLGASECDLNANCIPSGSSYECRCQEGYYGDGITCIDLDECSQGTARCDPNAQCLNTPGSYQCRCLQGFTGDGRRCTRDLCGSDVCDSNARCVYDAENQKPMCQCGSGYYGDGLRCQRVEFSCNEVNNCDSNADCIFDQESRSYRCECVDGFSGDGYTCSDTGERTGGETCEVLNNCDSNAQCIYDVTTLEYQCRCNAGFYGDGYRCLRQKVDDCNVLQNCDPNARCLYERDQDRFSCVCNPGYSGDGYRCVTEGCNLRNFCDVNAQCMYDSYSGQYVCQCNQGYEGDGRYCRPQGDCSIDQTICDRNAQCSRRGDLYTCVCNDGYEGDGRRCAPVGDTSSYLMYTQGMSIMQVPFNPTPADPGTTTLLVPGQTAVGIDVDCYSRYFYWTDVSGKTISKARLDGTDSEVIVNGLGSPEGVAVDWVGKNMYWTDSGLDRIEVSNVDGKNRKALFTTDLVNPRSIAVDPGMGLLFWTDWNRDAPKIETSYMDGTNRKTLVSTGLGLPNGLTIDFDGRQICWADAGTMHIECTNYDGRGRRILYTLASYPFGLAYNNNIFYWTDWDMKSLPSIDKYGGEPNTPMKLPEGGNGKLYGITAVRSQCPGGSNACVLNNGGCRFLCLPTPNGGRTCACPDDVDEEECNRIGLFL